MTRLVIWCAVSSEAQAADDKVSLAEQERCGRAFAEQLGAHIVAVLRVEGHSRWEADPVAALEDFARDGVTAYHQLRELWQRRAFDVLYCYTHSRLGRSFTMQSWVIENCIRGGARVYRELGGWINFSDFIPQIALGGMSVAGETLERVKKREMGIHARARRGILFSAKEPLSHRVVRDKLGRGVGTVVNEDKRRLFADLAALILERVPWREMEHELFNRFGHVDDTGRIYALNTFYQLVINPTFWGHIAVGGHGRKRSSYFGSWTFEEHEDAPEGVTVYRNVIPPVYTGALAEQVKAELRRRTLIAGRASTRNTHRYSSIFVCAGCGCVMSTQVYRGRGAGVKCGIAFLNSRGQTRCANKKVTSYTYLNPWFDAQLRLLAAGLPAVFDELAAPEPPDFSADIAALETRIARLIHEQSFQPEAAQQLYRDSIQRLSAELGLLRARAADSEHYLAQMRAEYEARRQAAGDLQTLTVDGFWNLSEGEKNQLLHRILGGRRLVIQNQEIIGLTRVFGK